MKKQINAVMVIGIVLFGTVCIACDTGVNSEMAGASDQWSLINTANDLAGDWEGTYTRPVKASGPLHDSLSSLFELSIPD